MTVPLSMPEQDIVILSRSGDRLARLLGVFLKGQARGAAAQNSTNHRLALDRFVDSPEVASRWP
jgi:hypothetical protein